MSAVDLPAPQHTRSTSKSLEADHDGRSSSLSDIGDNAENYELEDVPRSIADVQANDTEAETERLEGTPLKQRKHQNVVLTAENKVYSLPKGKLGAKLHDDQLQQTSDISSLGHSSEEESNHLSPTSSPRKRKRPSLEDDTMSHQRSPNGSKSPSASSLSPSSTPKATETTFRRTLQGGNVIESETDVLHTMPLKKQRPKMGKSKGKKVPITEESPVQTTTSHVDNGEALNGGEMVYSNDEDAEIEDAGDAELENAGKSEEGLFRKKSALDSLTALEKCFATLRDKLFDERLASANEELALLQQPGFAHPELLAMKEAVDHRRSMKIEYQQKRLKYKLQSLQRESVATKHQALSQYMQTVREIRDRSLTQLNKEFYQVQRERRTVEGDALDYMYTFTTKRSQQIMQQTAYNKEVSILSGVAKYAGFPAAPTIKNARPDELDQDMRNMGIALQSSYLLQTRPSSLRSSYSVAAIPRQTPAVEDFLERNAWANPKHAAHQQFQHTHRQVPNVPSARTPSSTPAGQKALIDLTNPQGSVSMVAEPPSGPNTSAVPTPATGEQPIASAVAEVKTTQALMMAEPTPTKVSGSLPEATPVTATVLEPISLQPRLPGTSKPDRNSSPSDTQYHPARDSHTPSALPKPLPFTQSAGSRASPPVRLSVKVEDVAQPARPSPVPHQFSSPAPAIVAGNGQRFGS
ncbi:MAG: hypothetical protein Q9163_001657 [Psora crenata]